MDDWEQPSTSAQMAAVGMSEDNPIETLQQQLAGALDRISALEQRVKQLEGRAQSA